MPEQELERLRQVADRLTDANQEALEAIDRMLDHEGERRGFVDDEAETVWEAEHLEATLVDVRDILGEVHPRMCEASWRAVASSRVSRLMCHHPLLIHRAAEKNPSRILNE